MTNSNFLSKSSSRSCSHSSVTSALTVGSPSAHRRGTMLKPLFLAMFFLLAGVGNVWGEKITNYTNIVTGQTYYIGATISGTDYYLSVDGSNITASIAGNSVTSKAEATAFVFTGSGTSWTIKFADGTYYLSLKNSKDNGKVQVVEDAATFTASNQSSIIRLTKGSYSIQKNNQNNAFGSYGNTQTDIWLEAATTEPSKFDVILSRNGVTEDINEVSAGTPLVNLQGTGAQGGCDDWAFIGWSKTQRTAQDDSEEMTLVTTVDGAGPYYAVYSHTESGGGSSEITFTPGTDTGESSVTKSGVTCTMSTMNNASYYQIYASESGTFTCSDGNITKIEFTCTASGTNKYGPGNTSANVGSYSYSGSTGTWTGEENSITLSSTAQVRMSSLEITCSGGSTTYYSTKASCCNPLGTINGSFF